MNLPLHNAPQNINDASSTALLSAWDVLCAHLQKELSPQDFRSWVAPLSVASCTGGTLTLNVPTRFIRDWVKNHYGEMIRKGWSRSTNQAVNRVEYTVTGKTAVTPYQPIAAANDLPAGPTSAKPDFSSPLDARFTFENFIIGTSNALAATAAQKVATSDSVVFNPLYIHGRVGLGKTHLLQAVAATLRDRAPHKKVVYMSAERFMFQFVQALRAKNTMTFKEYFSSVDVLLVDDIQFICGKESTQEEFFHTVNTLLTLGKQIILSSDRAPVDLTGLDPRLQSRMAGGLVAEITLPDVQLRHDILRAKCALMGRNLNEDVVQFLAEKITASVREMEGALNRLIAHAELVGQDITIDSAKVILADVLRSCGRTLTIDDIQKAVADRYQLQIAHLLSPRRARNLARPRQIAMYLCKIMTTASLPEIGRRFGGRDHTTILHGVRTIEALMAEDADLRHDVDTLKRGLSLQ